MKFSLRRNSGDLSIPSPSPPPSTGPARPIRFVYSDDEGKFHIDPQALAVLQMVKEPVGVISVCGRARQGKSYILNQLLGRSSGFQVASTHRPCTKGLWLWSAPIRRTALDGTIYNVILLDTEGIDAYDQTGTYSTQIFSLSVLLSSLLIYNQMGGIDEAALDRLSLVTEMTKHICVRASGGKTSASELGQFAPIFIWLLRDFYLDLSEDNRKITARDYLEQVLKPVDGCGKDVAARNEVRESVCALFPDRECFTLVRPLDSETELQRLEQTPFDKLRPEFQSGLDALTRFVLERTRPKQVGATLMNGPMLAGITQSFLDALNSGAVPTITSSWQSVEETECRRAYDSAAEVYQSSFYKTKQPEEAALREAYEEAVHKALATFDAIAVGVGSVRERYEKLLHSFLRKTFEDFKKNAYMEADLHCSNVIHDMIKRLRKTCHDHDVTLQQVLKVLDCLVSEYEASCHGPSKHKKMATFLHQSLEGPIFQLANKQIDEIGSERTALELRSRSNEDKMVLLCKQLEASEKQKSEYFKRYEDAITDKKRMADDYMKCINNLESKCSTLEERFFSLSRSLDLARKESLDWKKKYEQVILKQKAEEGEACSEIDVLKSKSSAIEASLAAMREQALSVREEAEEWKRKYHVAAREAKLAIEKATAMQDRSNKSTLSREDALRAEFSKNLAEKEEELKDKVARLNDVEQQLKTLKLGLKAAESEMNSYGTQVSDLKLEIKVLTEKLESANTFSKSYESRAKILEQEKLHLEEKYRSEFLRFDDLRERCAAAEKEAKRSSELADKALAEAATALSEKSDMQQITMERLTRIEKMERLIQNLERQKKDLTDEVGILHASMRDSQVQVALLEARVEERAKEIENLMKSSSEQRASTVQVLENLLETERKARAEANQRAESLSVQLQATQSKLDLLQQELTCVRLNESALDAKLKTASHGKRLRADNPRVGAGACSAEDARSDDKFTMMKKRIRRVFRIDEDSQENNPEDYTIFTIERLKEELVNHGFGAELLKLANPSRKQVLALYKTCILQKY